MNNQTVNQSVAALEVLVKTTESVVADFNIFKLATEINELINAVPTEYFWLAEQVNFFVDQNIFRNYTPGNTPENVAQRAAVQTALNRLSYATANVSGVASFDIQTIPFAEIFSSEIKEENYLRWLYTFRQAFDAEYKHDIVLQWIVYLQANPDQINTLLVSDKKIAYLLLVDLIWLDFYGISDATREYVLATIFYQSVALYCPVTNGLRIYLAEASSLEEYNTRRAILLGVLSASREPVPLEGDVDIDELITSLQAGTLGRPYAGENSVSGQYDFELSQLAVWFVEGDNWKKIITYYLQATPLVPFSAFLKNLAEAFPLTNPEEAEVIISFQELCRQNNILKSDTELLFWNENTGQFEWNHELLS